MAFKLKPCPFCGASAEIEHQEMYDQYKVIANHSEECFFQYLGYWIAFETMKEAADVWNKRVNE